MIHEHAMESCVFVGRADVDMAAARAAGVVTIRHRGRPTPPAAEPATEPPAPLAPPPNSWFDSLT